MDVSRTASYVLEDKLHRGVAGWLNEGAISAAIAFAKWQEENNVFGDVAEIGVHHGKFFILLANLRRDHERAFAVDVFEDQQFNPDNSGRGDLSRFRDNLRLYTDGIGLEIIKKDSIQLTRGDFYRGKRSNIRLFSVDGSHTAGHTFSDLTKAAQLLTEGGVIFLDDFYNPDWPGVQEGFYRFLANSSIDVVPFAYGNHKIYLCKKAYHVRYLSFVESDLRSFLLHYKRVEIGNFPVAYISLPAPELVFGKDLGMMQNVFSFRDRMISPRLTLGHGWATPQPNGVWTVGPRSELQLSLRPTSNDSPVLCLEIEPFLHKKRPSRRLSVTLNDYHLGDFVYESTKPERLEISLPPRLLDGGCNLQFGIEGPEPPSETIGTTDQRPLGFFFRQMRIVG
jgi:Methyltransferase domain